MASRWQSLGASRRGRSLHDQKQLRESKVLQPAANHLETSSGALGSLCRRFQRRLPLRAVSLNLGPGPSWKRLETPEPGQQGLQAAARSAGNALGAVSQRIQESCQSGTNWLVETQVKAKRRKRGVQKGSSPPPSSRSQKSTQLSGAAPARSALGPWQRKIHGLSAQMNPRAHPPWRSRREAAFHSPYSLTEPLCSPSKSDSELDSVGAGIQHLQRLSQELDEVIVAEERALTLGQDQAPDLGLFPLLCNDHDGLLRRALPARLGNEPYLTTATSNPDVLDEAPQSQQDPLDCC